MSLDVSQIVIGVVVVCLFLWRISYGMNNGLFAEAAGLIAVIASYFAVYYVMSIAGSVIGNKIGIKAITDKTGSNRIILTMTRTDKNKASTSMIVPHPKKSSMVSTSLVNQAITVPTLFSW